RVFLFQAEDGIRDDLVTGVQTCALPILESFCAVMRLPIAEIDSGWDISDGEDVYFCPRTMLADDPDSPDDRRAFVRVDQIRRWEIGRASCRERGERGGVAGCRRQEALKR